MKIGPVVVFIGKRTCPGQCVSCIAESSTVQLQTTQTILEYSLEGDWSEALNDSKSEFDSSLLLNGCLNLIR